MRCLFTKQNLGRQRGREQEKERDTLSVRRERDQRSHGLNASNRLRISVEIHSTTDWWLWEAARKPISKPRGLDRSDPSLSLSLSVRRLSCLFLDRRHAGSFHLSVYLSVSVSWLSRSLSRLGVAPLLRFTFAMSLPVRSGRGKSVTQAREVRGHRRGLDLVCVKQEKQGLPSSLDLTREERSLLCRFYAVEA